jgi:hypothetical protein
MRHETRIASIGFGHVGVTGALLALSLGLLSQATSGQGFSRLERGTVIAVRTTQAIDADRHDNRVYRGTVDQDVHGSNGRILVARGSAAELSVRMAGDNDLIIDLESIVANGERYAIKAEPDREESRRDNSLVGSIVGAIAGHGERGRAVRVPRDSVVTFRLERPLDVGVADRGYDRDGSHYHGRQDGDDRRPGADDRDNRR